MTGKPERSFVDTNILIYAFDRTAGLKQETAKKLLVMLQTVRTGFINIQVMQEFHVIVTQKIQQPLKIENSVDILRDLSKWYMHIPNSEDVLAAINIQKEYQLSFWDAMIVQSALSCACRVLYSEDLAHGQVIKDLKIVNPFLAED